MQSSGVCGYVDDTIVVLARRFAADPECHSEAWHQVSEAVFRQISRPATSEERLYFLHIDPALFTPSVCRLRCQYVLWKAKKQQSEQQGSGGGFNVTKDSIGEVVASLYNDAKMALPSSLVVAGDEEDSDDDTAVPIHTFKMKTQEEADRDAAMARAEDDLLTKVAQLQHEHFMRHRKWVDVPESMLANPTQATLKAIVAVRTEEEAAAASTNSIDGKDLSDFTVEDVSTLLRKLGLQALDRNFKRTDGALLQQLSKADIRHRTDPDYEAADILWAWMQKHNNNARGSGAAIMAAIGALRTPSATVQSTASRLSSFERGIGATTNGNENKIRDASPSATDVDPFVNVKRSFNPSRPQRPSATRYEDDEEEAEEILKAYRQDLSDDLPQSIHQPNTVAAATSPSKAVTTTNVSQQGSPIASPPQPKSQQKQQDAPSEAKTSQSASRSNRWNIVEYSDDDEDDEE